MSAIHPMWSNNRRVIQRQVIGGWFEGAVCFRSTSHRLESIIALNWTRENVIPFANIGHSIKSKLWCKLISVKANFRSFHSNDNLNKVLRWPNGEINATYFDETPRAFTRFSNRIANKSLIAVAIIVNNFLTLRFSCDPVNYLGGMRYVSFVFIVGTIKTNGFVLLNR